MAAKVQLGMRNSVTLFFVLAICAGTAPLLANWGSTAGGSVASGSFRSFGISQVEMLSEDLVIQLYSDRAKVEVNYILRNTGGPVDVRAGFPSLGVQSPNEKHSEIEEYAISANGSAVPFSVEKGDPSPLKAMFEAKFLEMIDMTDQDHPPDESNMLLEWFTSDMHFAAGERKQVRISYESLYAYCAGGYSDDSDTCDDRFAYVLSTAAAWKGPIVGGRVTIQAITVAPNKLLITPAGRFRQKGNNFVWVFQNLKPSKSDDILVNLNNHYSTVARYGEDESKTGSQQISYYTAEAGRYFYLSRAYVPRAEPSASDYPAENLLSSVHDTEWRTVHSPGIGDALILDLTKPAHISQVGVIPGCGANKQEWFSHTRIKEVGVSVNGKHKAEALLPDEYNSFWAESPKAYEWINLPPYSGPARDIRLTIRSVYPGTSDTVTCIKAVMLREWLRSKPPFKSEIDGHELP